MVINKEKVIKKYAYPDQVRKVGRKTVARIQCPGCGKWIESDGDLSDIEVCVTKRGSATVFHNKCYPKVWHSKIL